MSYKWKDQQRNQELFKTVDFPYSIDRRIWLPEAKVQAFKVQLFLHPLEDL